MEEVVYRERPSWRTFWVLLALLAAGMVADAIWSGGPAHVAGWLIGLVLVAGVVGTSTYARLRLSEVSLTPETLRVGPERLALSRVDRAALAGADDVGGPPVGAPVLGGAGSVPDDRESLPLRLTDGTRLIVPTRDPAALREALLTQLDRGNR